MRSTICAALMLQLSLPAAASPTELRPSPARGVSSPRSARAYAASDFFQSEAIRLPPNGGMAFSADGQSVLFGSDRSGREGLYSLSIRDGAVTFYSTAHIGAARPLSLFPSDGRVLFSADNDGDERTHIFVREVDGTVRDLTPGQNVKADFLGWSADRSEIRFLSNVRDRRSSDLYAIDTRTYEARLLLNAGKREIQQVSPDGRWAVLGEWTGSSDSNLYVADLAAGGEPRLVTPHQGKALHRGLGFTPDSSALIFITDADSEFASAWRLDLRTGRRTKVIGGNWDVDDVRFSSTGRFEAATRNVNGRSAVTIRDTRTNQKAPFSSRGRNVERLHFSPDGESLLLSLSSDEAPADIYVASLSSGRLRRITNSLGPKLSPSDLVEARDVSIRAADGVEIPSLVYRPKHASAARPVPAIVWVHGGPDQSRHEWSPTIQHLVNRGYAVIAPNFRGSVGFGKTFVSLDNRKHGQADLDDVVAAGDWMRKQNWVNGKVAVMGRSYGGFLALAALTFRPEAFDAGIDIFGISNWERTLTSIPPWWETLRVALYEEMGDPATDRERHRSISPLFHAKNIRLPLLVVQGANDPRVLQAESDDMVAAVRANGTPVEYLLFPDEGHGFRRRENQIRAQETYLDFLNAHLGDPSR